MTVSEHNQNFWILASIQSATLGLPVIMVGGVLASRDGAGSALISVIVGNLILWIIGLSIITMALQDRKNAIQNVESFLGKGGAIIASLTLILAFINWYILQLNTATEALDTLFKNFKFWNTDTMSLRLGAAFGFLTALFAMGGIKLIRQLCLWIFPFLLLYMIYSFFKVDKEISLSGTWKFSFSGIIATVVTVLPGTINLPTFFRHGRSKADCILALTLMTFFYTLFQSFPILTGLSNPSDIFNIHGHVGNPSFVAVSLLFVVVTLVLINMINIYFASAGWEMMFPHSWQSKEYVIVGLLGTAAYSLLQIAPPMEFMENMANNFIASLGIVLLMAFLVKIIVKHRPRYYEKLINVACWVFGCVTALVVQIYTSIDSTQVLILGMMASVLAFLLIIFVEETLWASKKLLRN